MLLAGVPLAGGYHFNSIFAYSGQVQNSSQLPLSVRLTGIYVYNSAVFRRSVTQFYYRFSLSRAVQTQMIGAPNFQNRCSTRFYFIIK